MQKSKQSSQSEVATNAELWECNDVLLCIWGKVSIIEYTVCLRVNRRWRTLLRGCLGAIGTVAFNGFFGVELQRNSVSSNTRASYRAASVDSSQTFNRAVNILKYCTNMTYLCLEPPSGDVNMYWCCSHSAYVNLLQILPLTLEVLCLRNWIVHQGMGNAAGRYGKYARELRRACFSVGGTHSSLCEEFADRAAALGRLASLRALLITAPIDHVAHPSRGHRYLELSEYTGGADALLGFPAWARAWQGALRGMSRLERICIDGLGLPPAAGLAGIGPIYPHPACLPWQHLRALHLCCSVTCGGEGGEGGVGATDEGLLAVAAACAGLEELQLDGVGPQVTDRALEGVTEGCPLLMVLSVLRAPAVRGSARLAAALARRRLRWLGLSGTAASEQFLMSLARQVAPLPPPPPDRPARKVHARDIGVEERTRRRRGDKHSLGLMDTRPAASLLHTHLLLFWHHLCCIHNCCCSVVFLG